MKDIGKNKNLMLFILPKYSWLGLYSPLNTKATVKYILRRDDAICKDKVILQILTALKNWLKKYCHCTSKNKRCVIFDYLSDTLCLYYALYSGVQSTKK